MDMLLTWTLQSGPRRLRKVDDDGGGGGNIDDDDPDKTPMLKFDENEKIENAVRELVVQKLVLR